MLSYNNKIMAENIEVEIEREIQEYKREYRDRWYNNFFNNFDGNLPGGYRTFFDSEILGKKLYLDEKQVSERRRNQTVYEFQEECRTAVIEAGLTPEQIIEARERYNKYDDISFFDMLLPVYIILRKRGYIDYKDLTS